jgi:glycosyltransferase involved in cell wall biosynthesis
MGLLAARATRVPTLVWCVHGCELKWKDCSVPFRMMLRVLAKTSRFVDTVVPVSQGSLRWHQELGYRPRRWELIRVGVDTAWFHPEPSARTTLRQALHLGPDSVLIGIVARFHPMKDHENFLRAMALLRRQLPDIDLYGVMAGSGVTPANEALSGLARRLQLPDRIHMLGERADVNAVMAGLDMLCSSSKIESCPTVVIEAMACGVPCAVTDVGDSAFIVGPTGQVAPPENPEALAQALHALTAKAHQGREKLGQEARRRAVENFSLEVLVDKYANLYRTLSAAHRNAV